MPTSTGCIQRDAESSFWKALAHAPMIFFLTSCFFFSESNGWLFFSFEVKVTVFCRTCSSHALLYTLANNTFLELGFHGIGTEDHLLRAFIHWSMLMGGFYRMSDNWIQMPHLSSWSKLQTSHRIVGLGLLIWTIPQCTLYTVQNTLCSQLIWETNNLPF